MTTSSNLDLPSAVTAAPLDVSQCHHTPFYCEENVYLLCKKLCTSGIADEEASDLFIVFISNEKKQVPLWHQKASHRADGIALWDYHVICIQRKKGHASPLVWDLDSSLPFPSPLASYVSEAIQPSFQLFSEFQRRHMKDSVGNWIHQPPAYEAIVAEDGSMHNLNEYIDISTADLVKSIEVDLINAVPDQKLGVVVSESQLEEFFSLIS